MTPQSQRWRLRRASCHTRFHVIRSTPPAAHLANLACDITFMHNLRHPLIRLLLIVFAAATNPLHAAAFRWAGAGELVNCDPHAATDTAGVVFMSHVYERLTTFDRNYQVAPSLATSWQRLSPTATRFALRRGVTFHDGAAFTADDVVFSIQRLQKPMSQMKSAANAFARVQRIDDFTVDIHTDGPLPTLLNQLALVPIMSRAWSVKHDVTEPQNFAAGKENHATRNANGTGPFRLKSFESGGKVVFTANPGWWGRREGNVTEATYIPIKSNGTRMAALVSGEVDLLVDPPIQDLEKLRQLGRMTLLEVPEPRVIMLGFDLKRAELKYASVKGKNPFQDRRVREAVRLAIDTELIASKVMRGHAKAIGSLIAEGITGFSAEAAKPSKHDPSRARQLLADAGYPDGFSVTLDCTNDRYLLDEQLCAAVAGMLTRVGINTLPNPRPKAIFFQKVDVTNRDTSLFILGAFPTTVDAQTIIDSYLHTFAGPRGDFNAAGYSNASMDALIDASLVELDPVKRNQLIASVLALANSDIVYVPLHQQRPAWAMRPVIETPARLDNNIDLRWVTVR
jgi:peptide/nickel transport system substrate-binding protein